jgi:hypothetical protein
MAQPDFFLVNSRRCRLRSAAGNLLLSSMSVRAFSVSSTNFYSTQAVPCLFPAWQYGNEQTKFSLLTASGEEVSLDSEGNAAILPVVASWKEMIGPTRGLASGGDKITIRGTGFVADAPGFQCVFSTGGNRTAKSTLVLLSGTSGECLRPQWPHAAGTAQVDIHFNGTPLQWVERVNLDVPFSVGNTDGRLCTGSGCSLPDAELPECLSAPCISNVVESSDNYQARNYTFVSVFYALTPPQAPASGGDIALYVEGWGWDASVPYFCAFSRGYENGMTVSGTVESNSPPQLKCLSPPWGQKYPGTSSASATQQLPTLEVLAQQPVSGQVVTDEGDTITVDHQPMYTVRVGGVVLLNGQGGADIEYVVYTSVTPAPTAENPAAVQLTGLTRGAYGSKATVHAASQSAVYLTSLPTVAPGNETQAGVFPSVYYAPVTKWSVTSVKNVTGENFVVTLTGSGFDMSMYYRFELRAPSSASIISWESRPANSTTLILTSRPWPFRERIAQLVLVDSSGDMVCESGVLSTCKGTGGWFPFVSSWQRANPTFAYARGGAQLEVIGLGFGPGETGYRCRFTSNTHEEYTTATAVSSTQLQCSSPVWNFPAEWADLTIQKDNVVVPHAPGAALGAPFEIRPNWVAMIVPAVPTTAAGGFRITLTGHGFLQGSSDYTCGFESADGSSVSSKATVSDTNTLSCQVPVWGTTRPGGWVRVSATATGSQTIGFSKRGTTGTTNCAHNDSACALYLPATYFLVSPSAGSSIGGDMITVSGYGFDKVRQNCSCIFGAGLERTHATLSSSTRMTCQTPYWNYGGGPVVVSVQCKRDSGKMDTVAAPQPSGIQGVTFEFQSSWISKDASIGTAAGGTPIVLKGLGFFWPGSQEYM